MDVFKLSADSAPKAAPSLRSESATPKVRRESAAPAERVQDSIEVSGSAQRAKGLAADLESAAALTGGSRSDLVQKFRALMDVGALDTVDVAKQAAAGLLGIE